MIWFQRLNEWMEILNEVGLSFKIEWQQESLD